MRSGDFHSFPENIKAFEHDGVVSEIIGSDNVKRLKLEISGSFKGKKGHFEFIKESDGSINHRLFVEHK